jgi:quercetin dioxygenase-like cupin family protein
MVSFLNFLVKQIQQNSSVDHTVALNPGQTFLKRGTDLSKMSMFTIKPGSKLNPHQHFAKKTSSKPSLNGIHDDSQILG